MKSVGSDVWRANLAVLEAAMRTVPHDKQLGARWSILLEFADALPAARFRACVEAGMKRHLEFEAKYVGKPAYDLRGPSTGKDEPQP